MTVDTLGQVARSLTNPDMQVALPPDFPPVIGTYYTPDLIKGIENALERHGKTLDTVGRITIAYPHKHPVTAENYTWGREQGKESAQAVLRILRQSAPQVEWAMADAICETRHFGRSENQSFENTLPNRQMYELHLQSQTSPLPFLYEQGLEKELFLIVDWTVAQGTTVRNLRSYIEHNGGEVIAVATDYRMAVRDAERSNLSQQPQNCKTPNTLTGAFADKSKNTARLHRIAENFVRSVREDEGREASQMELLTEFETALNKRGHSVFALTNSECAKLEHKGVIFKDLKAMF